MEKVEKAYSWDRYFYDTCLTALKNSKCFSRQIGAVIVEDKSIISTGYNGPPRGIPPCDERWRIDDYLKIELGKIIQNQRINGINDVDRIMHDIRGKCPRQVLGFKSGEGLEWCVAGHAEENTILNAARIGARTKNTKMYMSCNVPCSKCLVKIINAGIEEIIVTGFDVYDVSSQYLLDNSDLRVRKFDFL